MFTIIILFIKSSIIPHVVDQISVLLYYVRIVTGELSVNALVFN